MYWEIFVNKNAWVQNSLIFWLLYLHPEIGSFSGQEGQRPLECFLQECQSLVKLSVGLLIRFREKTGQVESPHLCSLSE